MDSFFFFFSSLLSLTAPLSHHQVRHLFTSKLTLTLCEGGRKDTGFSAVSAFSRTHTSPQNPNSPLGAGQPNKQTAIRSVAGQLLCLLSLHPHQQPPAPRRPAPKDPPHQGMVQPAMARGGQAVVIAPIAVFIPHQGGVKWHRAKASRGVATQQDLTQGARQASPTAL